jgi:predicted dithiol-disulfide oxidoreductase (DUF899 family)
LKTCPVEVVLLSDFNLDFNVWFTEEQQREGGIEYNYRRQPVVWVARGSPIRDFLRLQPVCRIGVRTRFFPELATVPSREDAAQAKSTARAVRAAPDVC